MDINYNELKLDRSDLNSLSDTIFSATDKSDYTEEELINMWKMLPEDIQGDAVKWGLDDSPTRDAMYVWFTENLKK